MMVSGTLQAAVPSPGPVNLERGYFLRKTLISSAQMQTPSPHAYLVEQSPGSVSAPHFHHNSEFQVIVAGGGTLGRHEVRPFTVHYAGQQTGYGPINAGSEGISYLTMRPIMETTIWHLPQYRADMNPRIPKLQLSSASLPPADAASLAALREAVIEPVIAPKPGGLAAWRVRVPSGAVIEPPDHVNGAGRFHVVIGGSLLHSGEALPYLGTVWTSADEPEFALAAGDAGLDLLVMQFPANAWEFTEPPPRRN